jgi:hypothetical protein
MATDTEWAAKGRELAETKLRWARDRRPDDAKAVAVIEGEMCREFEAEQRAAVAPQQTATETEGDAQPE